MKLLYTLKESQQQALSLRDGETIWYCVPVDLDFDNGARSARISYADQTWIVVTEDRLMTLKGEEKTSEYLLKDCEKIKCEHQVGCGIVTVFPKEGGPECIARFSMRHIIRVAYAVRGAQTLVQAMQEQKGLKMVSRVESREYEKYCEKCGRALPGTSKCMYCDGKSEVLKKFMALCGDFIGSLVVISLLLVLLAAINMLNPTVQRYFIDNALANGRGTAKDLWIFIGLSFVLTAGGMVCWIYRYWLCVKLGASLSMSLRAKLYYKIQVLSLSFINNRKPGELMNRVSRDTREIRTFMQDVFGDMFSTLVTMIVALVMMLIISWKMTLLSMVFVVAVLLFVRIFWRHIYTIYHKQWLRADDLSSNLQDILSGMRIVKSFGKEARESAKFTEKTEAFAKIQKKNETFWAVFFPIMTFLLGVGTYIAIYFGGIQVLDGSMTVGELVQFVTYSGCLFGPLSWMTHLPRAVMQMLTSLNRIYDVLDEEPMLADKAESKAFPIEGAFTFEDVSFGYQTYEPVLEHISFEVKPGEMIGLVGASGTGKSTLINLIMRLYDVDQGRITLDGYDLRDVQMESLHSQIGVVLQETFLFSGTILANIRFAKQDATLEEVIMAASSLYVN